MKLSVQLWTVRDPLNADPASTLRAMKAAGLDYVETAGYAGLDVSEFRRILDDVGLAVSGMHVGLDAAEQELTKVMDEAAALDSPYVIVPWIGEDVYRDGWDKVGARLEAVGRNVVAGGRGFAYHNHAFEFKDVGGKTGFDALFEAASPEIVKAQIDLWWAYVGGEDVPDLVRRHSGRTPLVHLKDGPGKEIEMNAACGSGILDWDPVLAACRDASVEFGAIELDWSPGDPIQAVTESVAFFKRKGS